MSTHRFYLLPALVMSVSAGLASQDMTEAQLIEKARGIHKRVITLDTHKDISATLAARFSGADIEDPAEREKARQEHRMRADPTVNGSNKVDFPKMRAGEYDCAFFIVYVGQQSPLNPAVFSQMHNSAIMKFDAIDRMAERFPDDIEIAYTPDDVRRIAAAGKLIACIGIENGGVMGEDLSKIALYQKRGARYMSITHNGNNQLGDSQSGGRNPANGGLTELGKKAVAEMNRVGIMVDVSHADKKTMLDAVAASRAPVIASHSGTGALRAIGRNLDDEQLLALKNNGGVIQCVALGGFVTDTSEGPATVSKFVDHIDHVVKTIGLEHAAISSDFDGGGGIPGWNDASETFNVTLEMVRRGYTEEQIGKIWSGNTLRIWAEVEAIAKKIQAEKK